MHVGEIFLIESFEKMQRKRAHIDINDMKNEQLQSNNEKECRVRKTVFRNVLRPRSVEF